MNKHSLLKLTELADIHDHLRVPVNQTERNNKSGSYPYYGATGQVGWIDDYKIDGRYVLLGEDGAPFLDADKPKAYIVEGRFWVNNHAHVLKGKEGICDDEYLCHVLNWFDYSNVVTGSTRLKLPQSSMHRMLIPAPPIDEQRRIAARLKAQMAEIEKARKAIEAQKLDITPLQSNLLKKVFSRLEKTSKIRIGDAATTTSGSTPFRDRKDYWDPPEIPWIKTTEVNFAPISKANEYISRKAINDCSLALLPPETVLVAMYGQGKTRGRSAILEMESTTNQACFAILPNDTWKPEFLYLWLRNNYSDLRALSEDRGGNQANLNGALLKHLNVPAPSKEIQKEIVLEANSALAEIKQICASIQSSSDDIEKLKSCLLSKTFRI